MEQYDIQMAPICNGLEKVRIDDAKKLSDHPWFNRTLCRVNDSFVRIGVFQGEFHWHAHEKEDEFFYVLEGELEIKIEGRNSILLKPNEGVMIPKNVRHKPKAPNGATVLMIEKDTIVPTGN